MGKLLGLGAAVTVCLVFASPFAGSTVAQGERCRLCYRGTDRDHGT